MATAVISQVRKHHSLGISAKFEIMADGDLYKVVEHPKPNYGASLPEVEAIKSDVKLHEWQKKVGIDRSKQVKILKIAHMRYQHPDLDEITTFLYDFGMHIVKKTPEEIWYGGYGPDPYVYYARKGEKKFLGGTFLVESYAELEK